MRWNFDEDDGGGGKPFKKGERYTLMVDHGEVITAHSGNEGLKLHFKTEDGTKAYDKVLWNTPKAAYRAKEWMAAMGMPDEGEIDVPVEDLGGVRLTAECDYRKADNGKEYVEWINPEYAGVARNPDARPAAAAPAPASSTPAPQALSGGIADEEVPF